MATSETQETKVFDDATRTEWLQQLDRLIAKVESWAEAADWVSRRIEKEMRDSRLGPYRAPALLMQRETVRTLLDPVGRFAST